LKGQLKELGLIEDITTRNTNQVITGHYIKLNFIWKNATLINLPVVAQTNLNALSSNNINALNSNKKINKKIPSIPKSDKKERNKKYLPLAQQIAKTVQTIKDIAIPTNQITAWTNDIRLLAESYKIDYVRIEIALNWYERHVSDPYTPVIESGATLRAKFLQLEDAINRARHPIKPTKSNNPAGSRNQLSGAERFKQPQTVIDNQK
jgi:hypothetical protein